MKFNLEKYTQLKYNSTINIEYIHLQKNWIFHKLVLFLEKKF